MTMKTIIPIRTVIYNKEEVSDPDTMSFHQATKENYATQFLKAKYKEFADLLLKGIFELLPRRRVPERKRVFPAVWATNRKNRY